MEREDELTATEEEETKGTNKEMEIDGKPLDILHWIEINYYK